MFWSSVFRLDFIAEGRWDVKVKLVVKGGKNADVFAADF